MVQATIKGFFNARKDGDKFCGLNSTIEGSVSDRTFTSIVPFLQAGGRDYFIRKVPAYVLDPLGGVNEAGEIVPGYIATENQFHLVRSSDHRVVSPHTVSDGYAPLSLVDMADELEPWCQAGWCEPDGVYSAKNESLEVLSLRINEGDDLPDNERFLHYIVFQNSHAAGGKAKGKIISFRIVCANTFAAAVRAESDFEISHRVAAGDHAKQHEIMKKRTQDQIAAWEHVQDHFRRLSERIQAWSDANISVTDAKELSNRLLGIGKDEEKASTRAKNKRDAIVQAFSLPAAGTNGRSAWDWLNAVTFINSSPNSAFVKKSKVSPLDRVVRNMDPNGTGLKFEQDAKKVLTGFLG